jgi:hypothetical protein
MGLGHYNRRRREKLEALEKRNKTNEFNNVKNETTFEKDVDSVKEEKKDISSKSKNKTSKQTVENTNK